MKEKVYIIIKKVTNMKVNIKMVKKMERVYIIIAKGIDMRVNIKMIKGMEKVLIIIMIIMMG